MKPALVEPSLARSLLATQLAAQGFYSVAFLSRESFVEALDDAAIPEATRQKYAVDAVQSLAVVALRYGNGAYPAPDWSLRYGGSAPSMQIARFARVNWYREISSRLGAAVAGAVAQAARQGIALPVLKKWHRLVNSSLPEKDLALKSGLGWMGSNTIIIARKTAGSAKGPDFSSAVLLGLLLCPVDTGSDRPQPVENRCGDCRRCIEACPTGALAAGDSGYERKACIQHWTAIDGELPPIVSQAMRGILYGCDSCLEACPYFFPDEEAACSLGRLGPALPASLFLEATDAELRRDLACSTLDRAWMSMEAFRRNARLAL
ncbi:MAG: 4Fe-4S double cluster binding domain-containing protein [Rectinemataceae bacterium]|nr:4Fe-4S double cluster binding domain-containing protein [Rectinemataceae bacterium]